MRNTRLWMLAIVVTISATLAAAGAQGPQTQGPQAQVDQAAQGLRRWSGTPIDVDYQSANLRSVLRNLAEIGGINLILDPSVPPAATVDLRLTQVPWDQVMDVVLKSAQLTYELEGPVLRVLTRDALTREKQAEVDQRKATHQAAQLDTLRVRLSPAEARSFVNRALTVVAAGRLPCPLCGQPLDPQGHICPRRNGHYVN